MLVSLLAIVAAVVFCDEVLKPRFIAKRWGAVVPGKVYRSGQITKYMIESILSKHDIDVIIDLTCDNPHDIHQQKELEVARKMGVEHHRFPLGGDGTGDVRNYAGALKLLAECEREGKPVLVHCSAGAQRTGGVVAAYRILVRKDSPQAAYQEMMDYGWRPKRDLELVPYLNANLGEIAALLAEAGVIDEIPASIPVIGPHDVDSARRSPSMLAN